MKRIRVKFIIVLVVVATLALLLIQGFQTANLYGSKSEQFAKRFSTSLDQIALKHERAEEFRRFMPVMDDNFSGKYRDILREEFQNILSSQEEISIRDTSLFKDGEMQDYLVVQGSAYDSISGLSATQTAMVRDIRHLRDLIRNGQPMVSQDSINIAVQLDQRVLQQIFKKAKFMNEMMLEVFRNNMYEHPSERIDVRMLDSILKIELKGSDLPSTFEFMVTDQYDKPIEFKNAPDSYVTDIDTSQSHRTLLFPSNTLDEDVYIHVSFPKQRAFLLMEMWAPLSVNLALVILIVVALVFMFKTILTQNKLSELKSDFISNMTHEFKTPISTISLACQAMNDTDMQAVQELGASPYVNMIKEENERLSLLVERILQSATLERGELKIREDRINLNDIVKALVQSAQLRVKEAGGFIDLTLPSDQLYVTGDQMHVRNMVSNLVDNAIKYSDTPEIRVKLKREGKKISIAVSDQGIGIKKEHMNKIFDKLYRIPTGNVHNVKGFGLGLNYVKAITKLHGWNVQVKSKFGIGSEFTILINN